MGTSLSKAGNGYLVRKKQIVQYVNLKTGQIELAVFTSKKDAVAWRNSHQDSLFLQAEQIENENKHFYRVIYHDSHDKTDDLALFTCEKDAIVWENGHADSFLVQYLVIANGHEIRRHITCQEKAVLIANEKSGLARVMSPGNLSTGFTALLYQECQPEVL